LKQQLETITVQFNNLVSQKQEFINEEKVINNDTENEIMELKKRIIILEAAKDELSVELSKCTTQLNNYTKNIIETTKQFDIPIAPPLSIPIAPPLSIPIAPSLDIPSAPSLDISPDKSQFNKSIQISKDSRKNLKPIDNKSASSSNRGLAFGSKDLQEQLKNLKKYNKPEPEKSTSSTGLQYLDKTRSEIQQRLAKIRSAVKQEKEEEDENDDWGFYFF
jgi:hypothetical protein